jgi:hypothetical protein
MATLDFKRITEQLHRADTGVTITVTDEEGQPYDPPLSITVVGDVSDPVRAAQQRLVLEYTKAASAEGDPAAQQAALEALSRKYVSTLAAAATIAWTLTADGEPVPATAENAAQLYRACPHILTQVTTARRSLDADFRGGDPVGDGADAALGADGATRGRGEVDPATPGDVSLARRRQRSARLARA